MQALTQYQGEGSCHDLAALLVTGVVQHFIYTLKEPAYFLFLDARSAFDHVVTELLIRSLYLAGMDGNTTNYINKRITNRVTYIDWDRRIITDTDTYYRELKQEREGKDWWREIKGAGHRVG